VLGSTAVNLLDVGMESIPIPVSLVSRAEARRIDGIHVDVFAPIFVFLEADDELLDGMVKTSKKVDESGNRMFTDL